MNSKSLLIESPEAATILGVSLRTFRRKYVNVEGGLRVFKFRSRCNQADWLFKYYRADVEKLKRNEQHK